MTANTRLPLRRHCFLRLMATIILSAYAVSASAVGLDTLTIANYVWRLQQNRIEYNVYNDSIFSIKDYDEWVSFFYRRAVRNHQIYDENKQILSNIVQYFAQDDSLIDLRVNNSMAEHLGNNITDKDSDPYLTIQLSEILLKNFDRGPDSLNRSMRVKIWEANAYYNIFSMTGDTAAVRRSYRLFQEVRQTPDKERLSDFERPYYYSVEICTSPTWYNLGLMTKQELVDCCNELKEVIRQPYMQKYQDLIKKGSLLLKSRSEKYLRSIYMRDSTFMSKQVADSLMRVIIARNLQDTTLTLSSYYRTVLMQMKVGDITSTEAFRMAHARYKSEAKKEKTKLFTDKTIGHLANQYFDLLYLNDIADLPQSQKRRNVRGYCRDLVAAYGRRRHNQQSLWYISIMRNLMTYDRLMKYLSDSERIDLLNSLMVSIQPTTYTHSAHVAELAGILMQGVLDYKPELLVGTLGCQTARQVTRHRKKYKDFIHSAAMYHDLGKNSIAPVVSNDYRPLTDMEFNLLKQHPAKGLEYLAISPTLAIFHDTTLGHHKWYNGKAGYPADFDNTQSPLRIMIDIVTICDCMQAATERLGRNYKKEISFQILVDEFKRDAGTRYNPDLVDLIVDHPDVAAKLGNSVRSGWYDIYYHTYSEYFKN